MSFLSRLNPAKGISSKAGTADQTTDTFWTTPWTWRTEDGIYVGHNKSVWVYRELPLSPLTWEDPQKQISIGAQLATVLYELADTTRDNAGGLSMTATKREIHLFSVTWDEMATPPEGTPEALGDYMRSALPFTVPAKALVIGVKLRSSAAEQLLRNPTGKGSGKGRIAGLLDTVKDTMETALGEGVPDLSPFERDRQIIDTIFSRNGCRPLTSSTCDQLEAWYTRGVTTDATVYETKDFLQVPDGDRIELAAVMKFEQPVMRAPGSPWLLDAMTASDSPAVVVSVRGVIEPASVARSRARTAQRRVIAQAEEDAASGDLGRVENQQVFDLAQEVEGLFASGEPLIAQCSIVLGRRTGDDNDSYIDELRNRYGIKVRPLEHRQLAALDETLPTSAKRVNPFLQDVTIPVLAYAGMAGFASLGDGTGLFVGLTNPDGALCFLNPLGAPAANKSPGMLVAGDPGSGKAQPLDARIVTPSGWTTMGELSVGDEVVAVDGTATRVAAVYPQGVRPIFRVTFHDGSSVEADNDHLWAVAKSRELSNGSGFVTKTTAELIQVGLHDRDGKRRWRIPMSAPVARPHADVPIDPYLLGLLLGDGLMTSRTAFSTADGELVAAAAALLPGEVTANPVPGRFHDYALVGSKGHSNPLRDRLRDLDLFGRSAVDKHIPEVYLHASVNQRVALLQGLMDTDGEAPQTGGAIFTTSSAALAGDVVELVESLGGTARVRSKQPRYSHHGEMRDGATSYQVTVRVPARIVPFRLGRKRMQWLAVDRPAPVRIIAAIDYVGEKEAQCILVDHPDHLYLTDRHIVTHNTFLCQALATQATLAGLQTFFINPKGFDSLEPFARLVGGDVVRLSQVEDKAGFFDPFRFCASPTDAAKVATDFILDVLGSRGVSLGFTATQELRLGAGMQRAAEAGARCVADCLALVREQEPEVVELVYEQAKADPTFRLFLGETPSESFRSRRGLTLIEFDRPLDFPEKGIPPSEYTRAQRIALAAVRLVTRACIEVLASTSGGMIVVDEAWTFLSSSEGLATVQRLGRLGRSQNILPVFATQRVDDLLRPGVDMEGYLSRVFVLKLDDEREATAALKLCGLTPTAQRIAWLRQAGPRRGGDGMPARPAYALHRDLQDRHAAVMVGPVPTAARIAFSTNPEERAARERLAQERSDQAGG